MKVVDLKSHPPLDAAVEERAADWLVRSHGNLSSDERAELQQWLSADPRHQVAYTELGETWRTLTEPRASGRSEELGRELETRRQRRAARRRTFALAGCGLAAAATLVFSPITLRSPAPAPAMATVAVWPDRQVLPDGSTVELNAGARIVVDFTASKRGVRLLAGEAMFAVRKDTARPFVVTAGGVEVATGREHVAIAAVPPVNPYPAGSRDAEIYEALAPDFAQISRIVLFPASR